MRSLGLAKSVIRLVATSALGLALAAGPARCQEAPREPVDLVRSLRVLQDRVTHGDAAAHQSQRAMLAQIAEQLGRLEGDAWKDPRNARAAVTFVLSGGDPRVLRKLLAMGPLPGMEEGLAQGALAYGEGRNGDAAELLAPINARALDSSMAGHVALIQSELIVKKDAAKAMAYLDEARLLSPGTLIEEAALRRQVAAVAGDFDQFQALSVRYLYRFPNSLYAGNFRREFASLVVERAPVGDAERLRRLELELAAVDAPDLREIYLSIAKEGLIKGKLEVTRFAARNAARLTDEDAPEGVRARLYELAPSAVTTGAEEDISALERSAGTTLGEDDAELLAAAHSVVDEIRRLPPESAPPTQAQLDAMAARVQVVAQARQAIERVDHLLNEAGK